MDLAAISQTSEDVVKSSQHFVCQGGHMPEWASYSIKEASRVTGYAEEYLRRLVRLGKIEAITVGPAYLIRVESLERYIRETQTPEDARTGPRSKSR